MPEIAAYVASAPPNDAWRAMLRYRRGVVRDGIKMREPRDGFLRTMVQLAENGLRRRGCNEEILLAPIWGRLEKQSAPADEARLIFEQRGMDALLDVLQIR